MYRTKVGVDLAKNIIQVCTLHGKKVASNVEMSTDEFSLWLAQSKPVTVAFEACSTSNYWYQQAIKAGHDTRLISAKLVKAVRQNQKTDKNDALAIAQTLFLPEVSFINGKSIEQQQLQSIQRLRELAIKSQNASQKQIVSLLLELNIRLPNTQGGFLRSQLIIGAMSVVIKVIKYGAKTKKELWLQGLMQRRGNRCAAVALANKTVRTAYSMLQNNTEYHAA